MIYLYSIVLSSVVFLNPDCLIGCTLCRYHQELLLAHSREKVCMGFAVEIPVELHGSSKAGVYYGFGV